MVGQAPDRLNREHPRTACSPDLGGSWAGAPARLSPIFAVSHRLSPLKVSAFFKRTLRPPAPPGGVFLHKAAHICLRFFVQTGELPQELFTPPHFVAFFCNKPPHSALWVKGLFHTHPPHHTVVNHRSSISRCMHASGVHGEPGRDPFGSLCSRQAALCGLPPRNHLFHTPINRDRTLKISHLPNRHTPAAQSLHREVSA